MPGIDNRYPGRIEVVHIAGNHRQTVYQSRRGDQRVAFRAPIGNRQLRASSRYGYIDVDDTTGERGQHLLVEPASQYRALRRVASFDQTHAEL